jgi:hypothetical protein
MVMTTKTINLLQLAVTALSDIDNGWPLTEVAALEGKGHLALIQELKDHINDLEPAQSLETQPRLPPALRYYQCTIDVSAREGVPEDDIRKVLDRLINTGLEDARSTLEDNEGDIAAAQLAVDLNISTPRAAFDRLPDATQSGCYSDCDGRGPAHCRLHDHRGPRSALALALAHGN